MYTGKTAPARNNARRRKDPLGMLAALRPLPARRGDGRLEHGFRPPAIRDLQGFMELREYVRKNVCETPNVC